MAPAAAWTLVQEPAAGWTADINPDQQAPASVLDLPAAGPGQQPLPDGRIASRAVGERGDIDQAWYAAPTTRYRHGVLGDRIEAGALVVISATGEARWLTLPSHEVFEDITPRLADLDRDGTTEVITILAD